MFGPTAYHECLIYLVLQSLVTAYGALSDQTADIHVYVPKMVHIFSFFTRIIQKVRFPTLYLPNEKRYIKSVKKALLCIL